jgi:hypothetical protein
MGKLFEGTLISDLEYFMQLVAMVGVLYLVYKESNLKLKLEGMYTSGAGLRYDTEFTGTNQARYSGHKLETMSSHSMEAPVFYSSPFTGDNPEIDQSADMYSDPDVITARAAAASKAASSSAVSKETMANLTNALYGRNVAM